MSDFGEAIIQRLNNSELQKSTNPLNRILNNAVGEWLEEFDDEEYFEQFFLQEATGKYLDLHGNDFNVKRRIDETDDSYRQRIINESLGHITVNFLKSVYNVALYTYTDNFSVGNNVLISDNPYISIKGFLGVTDNDTQSILDKKFVIGSGVTWL